MASGLRFGPVGPKAIHLCVDMQTLFAERTDWHVPWLERVLPAVTRLAEAHPERTVFTRFVPPERPEDAAGAWRRYYAHTGAIWQASGSIRTPITGPERCCSAR